LFIATGSAAGAFLLPAIAGRVPFIAIGLGGG
jgi:hypothetical protein